MKKKTMSNAKIRKYRTVPTPFHWSRRDGGWRIGMGPSSFLVAGGSGFSLPYGMNLLRSLQREWRGAKPIPRRKSA